MPTKHDRRAVFFVVVEFLVLVLVTCNGV